MREFFALLLTIVWDSPRLSFAFGGGGGGAGSVEFLRMLDISNDELATKLKVMDMRWL